MTAVFWRRGRVWCVYRLAPFRSPSVGLGARVCLGSERICELWAARHGRCKFQVLG